MNTLLEGPSERRCPCFWMGDLKCLMCGEIVVYVQRLTDHASHTLTWGQLNKNKVREYSRRYRAKKKERVS